MTLSGAFVGDVERGEDYQPIAVDGFLDVDGGLEDGLVQFAVGVAEQGCGFVRVQSLFFLGLEKDFLDESGAGVFAFGHLGPDGFLIDEILQFAV
jgi:hypothetical protein